MCVVWNNSKHVLYQRLQYRIFHLDQDPPSFTFSLLCILVTTEVESRAGRWSNVRFSALARLSHRVVQCCIILSEFTFTTS